MAKIKIKRGLSSNLSLLTLDVGEFGFCTDTKELYIGTADGNHLVTKVVSLSNATTPALKVGQLGVYNKKMYVGTATENVLISGFTQTEIQAIVTDYKSTVAPPNIAAQSVRGSEDQYARQDHTHGIEGNTITTALGYTPENVANKNQPSGYAGLDVNAKIPLSLLPDIIVGNVLYGGNVNGAGVCTLSSLFSQKYPSVTALTLSEANAAAYAGVYFIASANAASGVPLHLGVLTGDWIISNGGSTYANGGWAKIDNTDAVTGVKGSNETSYRTGNVNISKANIGLGSVDNTADANKPVSTPQQTALNGKENLIKNATVATTIADGDTIPFSDISATNSPTAKITYGNLKSVLKTYLTGFFNNYVLPLMSSSTRGGAKIDNITVKINGSEQLYVAEVDGGTF